MAEACLIFNPRSGRGRAVRKLERVRRAWGPEARWLATEGPGHAQQLAEELARAGMPLIAAVGGDGTVHEVANGLLRAQQPQVTMAVVPVGSANDYAWSLRREFGTQAAEARLVDVGLARAQERERFFVVAAGAGLNGVVTAESRRIRLLRGLPLYGLAALRALRRYQTCPQWQLRFDQQLPQDAAGLLLSVLLARREGNFRMAPHASLVDGRFDYVFARQMPPVALLRHLVRLAIAGPPRDDPGVQLGHCRTVKLTSESPLSVHVDGELLCVAEDNICQLQVELLPARLRVKLCPVP